jgi:ubiquinone/menaquinone biosynthesis C-methylase UbiE
MNAKRRVFEDFAADYDRWFDDHADVYRAQLQLLRGAVPTGGKILEIGVGSGRFAAPLGVCCGIDPSLPLARMAKGRGIDVALGFGEHLPYRSHSFDAVVMMTVICFLEDPRKVLREAFRVLVPSGRVIIGFIERDGEIFSYYHAEPEKGRFLRHARFYSPDEVIRYLRMAGFSSIEKAARERGFCVLTGKKLSGRGA